MKMNQYIADELANKVFHLNKALNQAQSIIDKLDEENKLLKETLANLGLCDTNYTEEMVLAQ
jgi:hypothetical protein